MTKKNVRRRQFWVPSAAPFIHSSCGRQGTSGIHLRVSHGFDGHLDGKTDTAACSEVIAHSSQSSVSLGREGAWSVSTRLRADRQHTSSLGPSLLFWDTISQVEIDQSQ